MRAWLDALEDKSLPSLVADAEGEVAAAFTVSIEVYRASGSSRRKGGAFAITKVPAKTPDWRGVWQANADSPGTEMSCFTALCFQQVS